jgi:hypothetical protein
MGHRKQPTLEDLVHDLRRSYKRHQEILDGGCSDPCWPDGTNLNLVRNHIFYFKGLIRERLEKSVLLETPKELRWRIPKEVSENYMSPRSKRVPWIIQDERRARRNRNPQMEFWPEWDFRKKEAV